MKYAIIGADRETGEDVELVVEADTEEVARAKASRRGVVVAECWASKGANGSRATSASHATEPPVPAKGRKSPWKSLLVTFGVLGLAFAAIYLTVIKPENDKINETLRSASDAYEKTGNREMEIGVERAAEARAKADAAQAEVVAEQAATAQKLTAVQAYVEAVEPVVKELQQLQRRVNTGITYEQYGDKLQAVIDAFDPAVEAPAGDADAQAVESSVRRAMDQYVLAYKAWSTGLEAGSAGYRLATRGTATGRGGMPKRP